MPFDFERALVVRRYGRDYPARKFGSGDKLLGRPKHHAIAWKNRAGYEELLIVNNNGTTDHTGNVKVLYAPVEVTYWTITVLCMQQPKSIDVFEEPNIMQNQYLGQRVLHCVKRSYFRELATEDNL